MTKISNDMSKGVSRLGGTFTRRNLLVAIPVLPLIIYLGFFFFWPMVAVFIDSFKDNSHHWSLVNFTTILNDPYRKAFKNSITLGLVSALTASIPGAIFAYIIEIRGSEKIKKIIGSLSGVLANTGGVPLAFMFIAAFGAQGSAIYILKKIGINLYSGNFTLFSFVGIVIVYLYFQIPLMVIVFSPAVHGIRREWRDAARNLGATSLDFWKTIGLPLLFPSFAASFLLLFASGFAAYATARAMTVGNIALVPLVIGTLVDGNVQVDQANVGKSLAIGMVVISAIAMIPYLYIQQRARKWQQ
jgi:putative spermidine/putrescine transport system permease protein